jgi:hypothetical protein
MKFTIYCWLLVVLAGTTALAQPHSKKKPVRKHAVVRRRVTESVVREPLLPPAIKYVETAQLPNSAKVYTYVEQMPTLNGQRGFVAIITAINQQLVIPPTVPDGRVFVRFEVNRQGVIIHPKIVKGLRADVDSAVVTATR